MRNHPQGRSGGHTVGDAPKTALAQLFRATATHVTHARAPWTKAMEVNAAASTQYTMNPTKRAKPDEVSDRWGVFEVAVVKGGLGGGEGREEGQGDSYQ